MNTCSYIGKDGQKCKARPVKGTTLCYWHTPQLKQSNMLASSKGGQNRRLQDVYGDTVKLNTPRDIQKFLSGVINAVWIGEVPVQVGNAMSFMTKCWLDAYRAADHDENDPKFGLGRFTQE